MYEQLREREDELDKKSFSPEALADEVGNSKEALYEWVKKNTLFVPYKGTLKGSRGVLMDRLGNSLDRALLLHELLNEAGYEVRLEARFRIKKQKTCFKKSGSTQALFLFLIESRVLNLKRTQQKISL